MSQFKLIDKSVLEQMVKDTSVELLPELLGYFRQELEAFGPNLASALSTQDMAQIADSAHSMKSSSGTFGAQQLHYEAGVLEQLARASDPDITTIEKRAHSLMSTLDETKVLYRDLDYSTLQ